MSYPQNDFIKMLPAIKAQFIASVKLGRPSQSCRNLGVCRIDPMGMVQEISRGGRGQGQAIVTLFEDHLELDFFRNSLTRFDLDKYFSHKEFIVEETFCGKYLGDDGFEFSIEEGAYQIESNNTLIKIRFRHSN